MPEEWTEQEKQVALTEYDAWLDERREQAGHDEEPRPLNPGDRVTWTRGGGWPTWSGGTVEKVGGPLIAVCWAQWDADAKKWRRVRRHCQPESLTRETLPTAVGDR